jgi:hypothetical protein
MPRLNAHDTYRFSGASTDVAIWLATLGVRIDLDANSDTSIRASADNVVTIEVAGADDFTIRANAFDVETGSKIAHNAAAGSYLSFLIDVNDNEILDTQGVASAVNQLAVSNSATGNPVLVEARGGDENIHIALTTKGTGQVRIPNASEGLRLGTVGTFGSTQPTNAVVMFQATAPVGAIGTSAAIFSDGTVLKKIIADGTASNVEA